MSFSCAREYQIRPDILLQNLRAAEQLYGQAVALDPSFALAHAFGEPLCREAPRARCLCAWTRGA